MEETRRIMRFAYKTYVGGTYACPRVVFKKIKYRFSVWCVEKEKLFEVVSVFHSTEKEKEKTTDSCVDYTHNTMELYERIYRNFSKRKKKRETFKPREREGARV